MRMVKILIFVIGGAVAVFQCNKNQFVESFIFVPSRISWCTNRLVAPQCICRDRSFSRIKNLAANVSNAGPIERPKNEFSRPLRAESILGFHRRSRDQSYSVQISATKHEMAALASRFHLSDISRLEADLSLRRDTSGKLGVSSLNNIMAEGTIFAAVKQTCVRTREDFDIDLEFAITVTVRATSSTIDEEPGLDDMDTVQTEKALGDDHRSFANDRKKTKKERRGRKDILRGPQSRFHELRIRDLQDLLQDFDLEEKDMIEDQAVFGPDGILDVGELVAQLFRLKLDPYPKKPGSLPVRYSITG